MDNRTSILTHSLDLFAARGYDAVGVQELAEAAGITKPTLYHYFGGKQGLLAAIVDTYHAELTQGVQAAAAYRGDLPQTLVELARTYFEFARRNPAYYCMQLALLSGPRHSEAYRLFAGCIAEQHQVVEALFAAAVKDHGNIRGRQRLYAATFIGVLNTCIALWLNGYTDLDEDLTRRVVHQFQHGIYS
jgi:AcrR family transcriptional regulator